MVIVVVVVVEDVDISAIIWLCSFGIYSTIKGSKFIFMTQLHASIGRDGF